MADDVARLVAVLEADLKGFTKGMEQAQKIADERFGAIEKRMRQTENSFANSFNHIGRTLFGGAALVGLERFVSSVVDAASKIKTTSQAIGVSTDALQEWGAIAAHSGVSQDEFNSALDRFSKNLGDASIKGGEMRRLLVGLGVDIHAGPQAAFLQFSDAIAQTGSQQQKVALVTALMGRDAARLVPMVQQGSAAIKAQGDEFKRTGKIIDGEAITKIDELDKKWADLKRQLTVTGANALTGFADEFGKFADELQSPAFQEGLKNFGKILAEVAKDIAEIATHAPDVLAIGLAYRLGGLPGAAIGAAGDIGFRAYGRQTGNGTDTMESLQARLRNAEARAASERGMAAAGARQQADALRAQIAARQAGGLPFAPSWWKPPAQAGDKDRSNLFADSGKTAAKAAQDAAKAYQDLVKALDAGNVEILQGTLGRFAAIRAQIEDNEKAELATTETERDTKLAALEDENKNGKLLAADYAKARNSIYEESASKESAIIAKSKTEQLQVAREEFNARFEAEQAIVEQRRDTVKSDHDLLLERAKATQDYYALARDLSDEDAKLDIQNIRDRLAHQLEAMDRQKKDVDKSSQEWADYQQERANAVADAELKIEKIQNGATANRIRLTEEETHALEYQVETMDKVRSGLEDVAVAGLHGFKSLKDAAVSFIEQLAEMALRLYVIRPLLEGVLGRAGTGGGFLGDLLGIGDVGSAGAAGLEVSSVNITPGKFAAGGRPPLNRWSIVGENGPEWFRPDSAGTIIPNTNLMRAASGPASVTLLTQVSLNGANGDETIIRYARQAAMEGAVGGFNMVKRQFPGMMVSAQQTHL